MLLHADIPNFTDFVDHFLSIVVGRRHYLKVSHLQKVSEYATKSDEALALLLLENSFDRWSDMAKKQIQKNSEIPPKFTNGGLSNGSSGRSKKFGGWSVEGLDRYDVLYKLVAKNRESENAEDAEEAFRQKRYKDFLDEDAKKKSKRKNDEPVYCETAVNNDLWSDEEDEEEEEDDDSEDDGSESSMSVPEPVALVGEIGQTAAI